MTAITTLQFVLITILIAVFAVLVFSVAYRRFKKRVLIPEPRMPQFRNEPPMPQHRAIFVDLSPKSAQVVELAVEIWRIQNRLIKASSNLEDVQKRGLESSVQKLRKYLDNFRIEIIDHTDQKYNEGLSVDVLSFENDPSVTEPMIKETVEPTIICQGNVVKKGKVVVIKSN
ncbi:MAG: hypothetical protein A2910_01940 [Candidatus Yanofskybacteria bacterium RIFCSPLOWO2_01_FULL_39_28]|nr:MAG: hypothetical protein A2910_01940 [Candidatus Yanofskybacteria bacterium RIFCSPLOWO2_01_FULL_39_28]